jgi:4-alpha-glucanotransferase
LPPPAARQGEVIDYGAVAACQRWLLEALFRLRPRSRLMLGQFKDTAGEAEQANLPGTKDEHPNWRRRLSRDLDALTGSPDRPHQRAAQGGAEAVGLS